MAEFTKALPANNQLQIQYLWSQSEINGYFGPMFYEFPMSPTSPYYPKASQLTCIAAYSKCAQPPDLAGGGDAVWTDPNNARFSGYLNVEQRVLVTFSGSNFGWDYTADVNYSKNTNDNRWTGGMPNEAVLAPGGVLSNLINPFGPQSAAGQALINSSYINGTYQNGEYTRWSVDGNVSHPLGDAFNSGTPATVALGASASGERYTNATTPYNTLVSAADGLGDFSVEGTRQTQAAFIELDVPITKTLDLDISDRQDRYSDFGTTNNAKVQVRYPADRYPDVQGIRFHRLFGHPRSSSCTNDLACQRRAVATWETATPSAHRASTPHCGRWLLAQRRELGCTAEIRT